VVVAVETDAQPLVCDQAEDIGRVETSRLCHSAGRNLDVHE